MFRIVTESTSDLTREYCEKNKVELITMPVLIDDVVYDKNNQLDAKTCYSYMRNGKNPTTSMLTPEIILGEIEDFVKAGDEILYISFSSALSGTYEGAVKARGILKGKYNNAKIEVVDSLSASLGQGLFVDYAVSLRDAGLSLKECKDKLEKEKLSFCHYFTVDDLHHLHRGGRVSKLSAVIGTLLQLKPILHVSKEGKLVPVAKVLKRKKSLIALADYIEKQTDTLPEKVFISHGDCEEDVNYLADLIRTRYGINDITIGYIGPVIGAHSGPNTVALFFRGKRQE